MFKSPSLASFLLRRTPDKFRSNHWFAESRVVGLGLACGELQSKSKDEFNMDSKAECDQIII